MLDLTDEQLDELVNKIAEDLDVRQQQEMILCGGWIDRPKSTE